MRSVKIIGWLPAALLFAGVGAGIAYGGDVSVVTEAGSNGKGTHEPFSVVFDRDGTLFGVEFLAGNRVFRLGADGELSFIAGVFAKTDAKMGDLGAKDGDDPMQAHFNGMHDLAVTSTGDIYLADTFTFRVRKIDGRTGKLSTVAGTGVNGFSGDGGPAEAAMISGVYACAINADETRIYLADLKNSRIRALNLKDGTIETVAGNGERGTPEDGAKAVDAPLLGPRAVTVDAKENVYIVSREGNALRVVDREGRIRTVVNGTGEKGYSGDGGKAIDATMNGPKHACVDGGGNVLIADAENHVVRKYVPGEERIHLVAGVPGKKGDRIGASPLETELNRPHGVRVDAKGNLYIVDSYNDRVLRVEAGKW